MEYIKRYSNEQIKYANFSYKNFTDIDDFVALDIETTGLSAESNEIINIGAIRFRNNKPVSEFDMLVKPDKRIPLDITFITGIDNNMVKNSPKIKEVLPLLIDFVGDDIVLGHNVQFDLGFINHAAAVNGIGNYITKFVDTLIIARQFRKNNALEVLVREYVNPDYVEKHQGLDDALNTARLFYVFKRMAIRKCLRNNTKISIKNN